MTPETAPNAHCIYISASAGTGKTFRLAAHLINLLNHGQPPQSLVALTFSRFAAGEIFNRIVALLTDLATGEIDANDLHLDQPCSPSRANTLLQTLLANQHLALIGTIDAFALRALAAYPLETGTESGLAIESDDRLLNQRALADILVQTDLPESDRRTIANALESATLGENRKTFAARLDELLADWIETLADRPRAQPPFPERLQSDPRPQLAPLLDELQALAQRHPNPDWPAALNYLRQGNCPISPKQAPEPLQSAYNYLDKDHKARQRLVEKGRTPPYTDSDCALFARLRDHLLQTALWHKLRQTQGLIQLVRLVQARRADLLQREGRLSFSDVTRLVGTLLDDASDLAYRLDGKLLHWALDEFQDTSLIQWNMIRPLVEEIPQNPSRTLFLVGDIKQAIYGWRGGKSEIFGSLQSNPTFAFTRENLVESFRYGPVIADFLNRLFDAANLRRADPSGDYAELFDRWQELWPHHTSHRQPKPGTKDTGDCVILAETAPGYGKPDSQNPPIDAYAETIAEHLLQVAPWRRGLTAAVLVRSNDHGRAIANYLRAKGMPALFEGDEQLAPTPVATALLDLLWLIDHPADPLARFRLCHTPLSRLAEAAGATAKAFPSLAAGAIARTGLAAAIADWSEALRLDPETDAYSLLTLRRLVDFAAAWEASAAPQETLSDFVLKATRHLQKRQGDARTVRVMTIHHSKGATLDLVCLPLKSQLGFTTVRHGTTEPLPIDDETLILRPAKEILAQSRLLQQADHTDTLRQLFGELCTTYVAMTRARRELFLVAPPPPEAKKPAATVRLQDLVRAVHPGGAIGARDWYLDLPETDPQTCLPPAAKPIHLTPRRTRTPSAHAIERDRTAETLLAPPVAADRGSRIHAAFERIDWLDSPGPLPPDLPQTAHENTPLRRALLRPENPPAELWREHPFEYLSPDGYWSTGIIDRAHIWHDRAEILDYKSNTPRPGETLDQFHHRLAQLYTPQLRLYRDALSALTRLPPRAIALKLLLTHTGTTLNLD
ncbi:MAG: UvrD-helicase domain-containing protein [Kiritimatiellia bacterium]|nr:UvrD-helicase domain-containing protein [Kiritimatiellia bacterium]